VRQEVFPAASLARTVTVLLPISKGTVADQAVVPLARPDRPKLVLQVTCFTPMLSLAVPFNVTNIAVVDIVAVEGEVMVRLGAVVSVGVEPGGESRVTVTVFAT
jgi:hypothetical protein